MKYIKNGSLFKAFTSDLNAMTQLQTTTLHNKARVEFPLEQKQMTFPSCSIHKH